MTRPFGLIFPGIAIALAIVAVVTGPDYSASLPAAIGATAAAAVTLADAVHRSAAGRQRPAARPPPDVVGARAWLGLGSVGRQEIVRYLDRLDRGADHPDLPVRPAEEIRWIAQLPDEEFRAYVNGRLDSIEGPA